MTTPNIPATLQELTVPITELNHYGKNPRKGDVDLIAESLKTNGQYKPITVRAGTNEVLAGNHTLKAAKKLGWDRIAVTYIDVDDEQAARIVLVDNRANDLATYDDDVLRSLLQELPDLDGTGYTDYFLDEVGKGIAKEATSSLVARFGAPPFTVLDARSGPWQARKRAWKELGIQSEVGRDRNLLYAAPGDMYSNWMPVRNYAEAKEGRPLTEKEVVAGYSDILTPFMGGTSGTSIFDPVLTELMYRWFSPPRGKILDPWAGGSVRGLVAARLGRQYTGIELSENQINANRLQAGLSNGPLPESLAAPVKPGKEEPTNQEPSYHHGESAAVLAKFKPEHYDMIIGCPPYYDLEVYSDDPRDLSNLGPEDFDNAMIANVKMAARALKPNSYAVFVVGAVRNKAGHLMDMRSLMVRAGQEAGLHLENDAILLTTVGTLRLRAARAFAATRALGRTHQDVLVFLKGDRVKAAKRMGTVDVKPSIDLAKELTPDDDADEPATEGQDDE
jgi:hypothetical protein